VSVFVAVPTYSGAIEAEAVISLVAAIEEASALGRKVILRVRPGDSLLTRARNVLVTQFLDTDADALVFWDADIACAPGDFARLISAEGDIVAGAYRFRSDPEGFPIRVLPEGWVESGGLFEVEAVPAGFLRITRAAIEAMMRAAPDAVFTDGDRRIPSLFENAIRGGEMWSEDFVFCARARKAGLRVFVEPQIRLTHVGRKAFVSDFNGWLARRLAAAAPPGAADDAKARLDAAYSRALSGAA
jgi:glycosyltransferase involved in cell wall biosynthesis